MNEDLAVLALVLLFAIALYLVWQGFAARGRAKRHEQESRYESQVFEELRAEAARVQVESRTVRTQSKVIRGSREEPAVALEENNLAVG